MPIVFLTILVVVLLDATGIGLNEKLFNLLYVTEDDDNTVSNESSVVRESPQTITEEPAATEFNIKTSSTMATNDEVLEALSKIHVKR